MRIVDLVIAAGWLEWAGPVIVFILYSIGQLVMNQGKKPAPQQRPPQKPRPAVPPQQQPRTLEEKLRGEVEDFLRQVQGDKPKQGERPRQPQAAPRPAVTQRPLVVKVEQPAESVVEVEPARVSLQDYVSQHMSTADVTQHAATLGAEVGLADEKMVAHLQERFQHRLGALEQREQQHSAAPLRRSPAAAEIAELLKSPKGMRQVIVASEILRRPEF
jgi:hypothetical protein